MAGGDFAVRGKRAYARRLVKGRSPPEVGRPGAEVQALLERQLTGDPGGDNIPRALPRGIVITHDRSLEARRATLDVPFLSRLARSV